MRVLAFAIGALGGPQAFLGAFNRLVGTIQVMGAKTVVTGLSATIAHTLVALALDLETLDTLDDPSGRARSGGADALSQPLMQQARFRAFGRLSSGRVPGQFMLAEASRSGAGLAAATSSARR
jgi:hypothetical protein